MRQAFGSMPQCRIAMETGTHSPWASRLLTLGHEVIVGHAQKVRSITKSRGKEPNMSNLAAAGKCAACTVGAFWPMLKHALVRGYTKVEAA